MNNIALGRYLPIDSCIHKLDPRTKIIALILIQFFMAFNEADVVYACVFIDY